MKSNRHTYEAFGVRRTTENVYWYASRNGSDGVVRFHQTYRAARRAAGSFGRVSERLEQRA